MRDSSPRELSRLPFLSFFEYGFEFCKRLKILGPASCAFHTNKRFKFEALHPDAKYLDCKSVCGEVLELPSACNLTKQVKRPKRSSECEVQPVCNCLRVPSERQSAWGATRVRIKWCERLD